MNTSMPLTEIKIEDLNEMGLAKHYLEECLNGDDIKAFANALREVTAASIGMTNLARKTGFAREALYRSLSGNVDLRTNTLQKVLKALGFKLSVQIDEPRETLQQSAKIAKEKNLKETKKKTIRKDSLN